MYKALTWNKICHPFEILTRPYLSLDVVNPSRVKVFVEITEEDIFVLFISDYNQILSMIVLDY